MSALASAIAWSSVMDRPSAKAASASSGRRRPRRGLHADDVHGDDLVRVDELDPREDAPRRAEEAERAGGGILQERLGEAPQGSGGVAEHPDLLDDVERLEQVGPGGRHVAPPPGEDTEDQLQPRDALLVAQVAAQGVRPVVERARVFEVAAVGRQVAQAGQGDARDQRSPVVRTASSACRKCACAAASSSGAARSHPQRPSRHQPYRRSRPLPSVCCAQPIPHWRSAAPAGDASSESTEERQRLLQARPAGGEVRHLRARSGAWPRRPSADRPPRGPARCSPRTGRRGAPGPAPQLRWSPARRAPWPGRTDRAAAPGRARSPVSQDTPSRKCCRPCQ